MSRSKILAAGLVVLSVGALLSLNAGVAESVADECRAKPGAAGPHGTHWRYRVSRSDHQRCWFLNFEAVKARSQTREAVKDSASSSPAAERDDLTEAGETPKRGASIQIISVRASAATASAETATTGPAAAEGEAAALFSARWPKPSKVGDFDVREFAATPSSYAERYSATGADEQMPLVWPVAEVTRARPAPGAAGETAWRTTFQIGALLVILLAIAGAAFKLAVRWRQSHALDPRRMPDEAPVQRNADQEVDGHHSHAEARQDRHGSRPVTPTDPARDLKKSLAELMGDLRRARTSQDAPQSFAPHRLGLSRQKSRSARDLLPPIDGWGEVRAGQPASTEKAPTWSTSGRAHVPSSDLPQTTLPAGPSLVPA